MLLLADRVRRILITRENLEYKQFVPRVDYFE
jgi:hypothetical protein